MLKSDSPFRFTHEVAAEGIAFQDEWPYAIHLLGHIYVDDINSARFLWKTIPTTIKENQPEVVAAWKVGQKLWMRDYRGVHEAIREFDWSQEAQNLVAAFSELYTKKMFQLLQSAYSTISIQDTALFLGMNEDQATNYVVQQGWIVDPATQMLTVKKQPIVTEQKLDPAMVVRNGDGKLLWLSSFLFTCRSPFEAELVSLNWASKLAETKNWRNIQWEVDAKEVVKIVHSMEEPSNWFTAHDILELRSRFVRIDWSLNWISRTCNGVADLAAKFSLSRNVSLLVDELNIESLPFSILELVDVEQTAAL
ncbi:hypothetical protein FNV43_RR22053 [Rhamnella rubrinervis]|uniref:COP9 signalosome complex subunit 8 n=1 Tax=Rhamnella rubrinervis TaxID=2594499 RepID=A0A8K0GRQ3_9ROSA|nr:hypothetical protein FNV43_RR22053 [Rhamnella rubrinervis]